MAHHIIHLLLCICYFSESGKFCPLLPFLLSAAVTGRYSPAGCFSLLSLYLSLFQIKFYMNTCTCSLSFLFFLHFDRLFPLQYSHSFSFCLFVTHSVDTSVFYFCSLSIFLSFFVTFSPLVFSSVFLPCFLFLGFRS